MSSDKLKVSIPAFLLILCGFLIAYQFVDPAPPSKLTFSAGSKEGAYYAHALAFQDYLAKRGITVEVLASAGSLENVTRLQRGEADVAFVQSGITDPADEQIASLGSMYYEPLWLFVRNGLKIDSLNDLKGKTIAVGAEGSGTRVLALQLLKENGLTAENSTLSDMGGSRAAKALLADEVDVVFLVAAATAEPVLMLNADTSVSLLNFDRADAYTRRIPTLSAQTLQQGALNLGLDSPARDIRLLAATATLQVNNNLHPALQDLIMQAAAQIHVGRSLFSTAGEFPTPLYTAVPLSYADELYNLRMHLALIRESAATMKGKL